MSCTGTGWSRVVRCAWLPDSWHASRQQLVEACGCRCMRQGTWHCIQTLTCRTCRVTCRSDMTYVPLCMFVPLLLQEERDTLVDRLLATTAALHESEARYRQTEASNSQVGGNSFDKQPGKHASTPRTYASTAKETCQHRRGHLPTQPRAHASTTMDTCENRINTYRCSHGSEVLQLQVQISTTSTPLLWQHTLAAKGNRCHLLFPAGFSCTVPHMHAFTTAAPLMLVWVVHACRSKPCWSSCRNCCDVLRWSGTGPSCSSRDTG